MFERFTDRAKKSLTFAGQEAQRTGDECIGSEHLLLGVIRVRKGVAVSVLRSLDIDLETVVQEVERIVVPRKRMVTMGQLPFTPRAKKVLELSMYEASALAHNYIGTEHLLLGLIAEREGVAANVMINLGIKMEDVRQQVADHMREPFGPSKVHRQESQRVTSRTVWTHWHKNGQRQAEGSYENHKRQGEWTFWNEDGSVDEKRTGLYEDDELIYG